MNLYLISQQFNSGYDTFDSAVVAAKSPKAAQKIHPDTQASWDNPNYCWDNWAEVPEQVKAEYIGKAKAGQEEGIILASFNAG